MDDTISRQAAIDIFDDYNVSVENGELEAYSRDRKRLCELPSAQPEKRTEERTETHACDLISRQAALHLITEYNGVMDKSVAKRLLMQMPSAQPERKTGRWIEENPQNSPDCRLIKCSECGDTYIVNMSIDYADWIEGRNFCRRCGADLRGGNNGKST